jgi:uncharacterized membrane protein YuzA (DUF378 family)
MGIVGCGFMLTGLLLGALSDSITLCLAVVGIGAIFALSAYAQEQRKERQAQQWRKNYPSYKY